MTEVRINDGTLDVTVTGIDKVLAMRSRLDVPLTHVRGASQDPDALRDRYKKVRVLGSNLPGAFVGTFYDGSWWFLDVHHPEQAVKIDLDHEHYAALVVEVEDPATTVRDINAAIHAHAADSPSK